jgi:hypothetical protein
VQGSRIARRGFASQARQTGLQAAAKGAESDRMGAVLAFVVADLARPWTKERRKRGLTTSSLLRSLHPTGETSNWKR